MSKETGVIILGLLVVILPFLGFPESWRIVFFVIIGGGLIVLGFLMRAEILSRSEHRPGGMFVENKAMARHMSADVRMSEQNTETES